MPSRSVPRPACSAKAAGALFERVFYSGTMQAADGTGMRGHYAPKPCLVKFGSQTSPGIVLEWRKTKQGMWEAYVIHAVGGGNVQVSVHLQWLPAAHVKPRD
jgi:hypothetical protein